MAKIYEFELHSEAKKVACMLSKPEIAEEIMRIKTYIEKHKTELYTSFMQRKLEVYELALKSKHNATSNITK